MRFIGGNDEAFMRLKFIGEVTIRVNVDQVISNGRRISSESRLFFHCDQRRSDMRAAAAILFSVMSFSGGILCYSQDPCAVRHESGPKKSSISAAEIAHGALVQMSPDGWNKFAAGDVEFILRCGTQEDADRLFAVLHNTSMQMGEVAVQEANQNAIRVVWHDGNHPALGAFRFEFDKPISLPPSPGEKVIISGTYSSYSRAPFRINMTNAAFTLRPLPRTEQR